MDTGIFKIFDNKNIVSLLVLPTYKTQWILEPIFKLKKCDLYPSIYGNHIVFKNNKQYNVQKNCRHLFREFTCIKNGYFFP